MEIKMAKWKIQMDPNYFILWKNKKLKIRFLN